MSNKYNQLIINRQYCNSSIDYIIYQINDNYYHLFDK